MKTVFAFLCFITFSIVADAQTGNTPVESQVMMKMASLRAALLKKDSASLSALLSEDVTYGHSNGWTQTKTELIHSIVSKQQDYKKIEVKKMAVRVFGESAVVNLESLVSLEMDGKPMDLDMDILLVWIKKEGDWKLVARQSVKNM